MSENRLSHLDDRGQAHMVDVSAKPSVARRAVARATVRAAEKTVRAMLDGEVPKGDVAALARVAGIMAAKQTSSLIPLCHPLPLEQVALEVEAFPEKSHITVTATASTTARTGVEMEALTAAAAGALTVYDMLKGIDKTLVIDEIVLVEKTKE